MESEYKHRITIAGREALFIITAAVFLGFAYTAVMKKGFFLPAEGQSYGTVAPVFISYEEAVQLFNSGDALFVDARHEYDYSQGHVKGAINVPLADFKLQKSALSDVKRDQTIVTYCDGAECNSSIELAKLLSAAGFTKVKMFFGGWNEWQSHQQPSEKVNP